MNNNLESANNNIIKSLLLIIIIFVLGIGYLIYNGNLPLFEDKKQETQWQYERKPKFESPLASYAFFEPITILWEHKDKDKVIVSAGKDNHLKEYTLIADKNFVKVKNGAFGMKTNDTYVKLDGTNYYLYAYNQDGTVYVGLAE